MALLRGACGLNQWPAKVLPSLLALALAACGGSIQDSSTGSTSTSAVVKTLAGTTDQAALPMYSVATIALDGTPEAINATGQIIFNRVINGNSRAYFYNGSAVVELPLPANASAIRATYLNANGEVTGTVQNADNTSYSFVWSASRGLVDTRTLMGPDTYAATGNNVGQLAGVSAGAADPSSVSGARLLRGAFWSQADGLVDMGTLGGKWVAVKALNNNAQAVGEATLSGDTGPTHDGFARAFVWSKASGMVNLQTIQTPNLTDSQATYITDNGQVIGSLYLRGQGGLYAWAFYWSQSDGMIPLTALGGPSSYAVAINNAGQVVGTRDDGGGFLWTKAGGMTTIPGLAAGTGASPQHINDSGQVVGTSNNAGGEPRAFVWSSASGTVDLNSRLTNAPAGLVVTNAYKISTDGTIVASSSNGLVLLKPAAGSTPSTSTDGTSGGTTPPPPGNTGTSGQSSIPAKSGTAGVTMPTVLDMSAGSGPQVMPGVASQLSSVLGASLNFTGQTSSGTVVLTGANGTILAFSPIGFQSGDARANGVYPIGNGQYQVVTSGNALTITPAVVSLDQLAGLLPGAALTVSDKGIVSGNVGGTVYSVQPDVFVTGAQAGAAGIVIGADGVPRFTDAAGNTQRLNSGFVDVAALQASARTLDSNAQVAVNLDGTISLLLSGQRYTLVPDLTLGAIPADKQGQGFWQEGANRYRISNANTAGTSQGFTVR